jgi:hypothetical protein
MVPRAPELPSLQTASEPPCPGFDHLITEALMERVDELAGHADSFIDPLPISLAK